jgi:hypothetical protein
MKGTCVEWTQYRRKGVAEMRPYCPGEDLTGISVSDVDHPPALGGMIARNPLNETDQWYVARQYFEDNFEAAAEEKACRCPHTFGEETFDQCPTP